jgi:Flp pilus assembly protein TadB
VLVLLAVAIAGAVAGILRRRIGRDDTAIAPDQRIVRAWERTQHALRRRGLGRRESETPDEYAARLDRIEARSTRGVGAEALRQLAALVELACYTPRPCTVSQADVAAGCASSVIMANRRRR